MSRMLTATIATLAPRLRLQLFKPNLENFAFKLHYRATVVLLLACIILVCAKDYFGDAIRCLMSGNSIPSNVIENYCFFMATFTIVRHYNESMLQAGFIPHPGVGPLSDHDDKLHHTYYQWVPFVLFLQSIGFYLPHYIWKSKEGGRLKALVAGLQDASLILRNDNDDLTINGKKLDTKSSIDSKIDLVRKDIILRLRVTRTWSTWLVSMEVVNLLHIIFEIWLVNKFLNGQFISLGPKIFSYSSWNEQIADPLETVFPKVAKCVFHKYGPSGLIQQHDALCVMALNVIHEKIYMVLWFWFLMLFIVSVIAVIWRFVSFFMYRRSLKFNEMMFRHVTEGKFNPYNVLSVVNGCQYGDWLFLYYLGKNMHTLIFRKLFESLAEELEKHEVASQPDDKAGGEPVLVSHIDYDDETLPLKDEKKVM